MSNGTVRPESDLDPTNPYVREAQTPPRPSEEMAARGCPHLLLEYEVDPNAGGFLNCFELTPAN